MDYWALSDEELIAQCDWFARRASGRGGQKRNKTSSAITLRHRPTDITVVATESRLQGENREKAVERLRHALALTIRREVNPETFVVPAELREQVNRDGKLKVNPRNPRYLAILAAALDVLAFYRGQVSAAAERLGITTTNLINLLHDDPKAWTVAQAMRKKYGLPVLKP